MSGTAYRLTPEDEDRITDRMRGVVGDWTAHLTPAPGGTEALHSLVRIGAHAIGCSTLDLRDVELEWIEQQARTMLGQPEDQS